MFNLFEISEKKHYARYILVAIDICWDLDTQKMSRWLQIPALSMESYGLVIVEINHF